MSINGIEAIGGFTPLTPVTLRTGGAEAASGVKPLVESAGVSGAGGAEFGDMLSQGLQNLEGLHDRADQLAVQAATGDLQSLHDYTITATEASVATQLTTAVRNKAVEAFQEIMRMSI
nr:flagellar hook-basal body complex protein FliE [uncultured Nocardioides sp.]